MGAICVTALDAEQIVSQNRFVPQASIAAPDGYAVSLLSCPAAEQHNG